MERIFGINWKTTFGTIMTAIGLVPEGIRLLDIANLPEWIRIAGIVCSFISFIYAGINAKDKGVTGAGKGATRPDSLNQYNQL